MPITLTFQPHTFISILDRRYGTWGIPDMAASVHMVSTYRRSLAGGIRRRSGSSGCSLQRRRDQFRDPSRNAHTNMTSWVSLSTAVPLSAGRLLLTLILNVLMIVCPDTGGGPSSCRAPSKTFSVSLLRILPLCLQRRREEDQSFVDLVQPSTCLAGALAGPLLARSLILC